MTSNEEKIRAAIAEQAGEWFVSEEEGPLDVKTPRTWRRGSRPRRCTSRSSSACR